MQFYPINLVGDLRGKYMLGPIGANLMSILKVLTPSEIDLYSEVNEEVVAQPMAVGAENIQYDEHSSSLAEEYKRKLAHGQDEEATEDDEPEKAKIIPINKKVEQELSENGEFFEQKPKLEISKDKKNFSAPDKNSLNAIGILSKNQQREIEEEKQRQENSKKDSTSVFILDQRERLKQSRMRLVEQKAISQYQKNASAEIMIPKEASEENVEDEEIRDSSSKGILVNKRHY